MIPQTDERCRRIADLDTETNPEGDVRIGDPYDIDLSIAGFHRLLGGNLDGGL